MTSTSTGRKPGFNTVTFSCYTFTILFPDLLRPLTPEERQALRDSISVDGVMSPVIVDEDSGVIDGGNRVTLASELWHESGGKKTLHVPTKVVRGLTLEQKAAMALTLNVTRRHLDPGEVADLRTNRQARIDKAVHMRQEGASLRAIAEEVGVSAEQVRKDLKSQVSTGLTPDRSLGSSPPARVNGRDGKAYPAAPRPEVKKGAAPARAPQAVTVTIDEEPERPKESMSAEEFRKAIEAIEDEAGRRKGEARGERDRACRVAREECEKALIDAGKSPLTLTRWEIGRAVKMIAEARDFIETLIGKPGCEYLGDHNLLKLLGTVRHRLKGSKPHAVGCVCNDGKEVLKHCDRPVTCWRCGGRGWVCEANYKQLDPEDKKKVRLLGKRQGDGEGGAA